MKRLLAAAALAVCVVPAQAVERYNIDAWACARAQSVIAAEGAAILRYTSSSGSGMTLYDRFVANSSFCPAGQYAAIKGVPTADRKHCPLYYCKDIDYDYFPRIIRPLN